MPLSHLIKDNYIKENENMKRILNRMLNNCLVSSTSKITFVGCDGRGKKWFFSPTREKNQTLMSSSFIYFNIRFLFYIYTKQSIIIMGIFKVSEKDRYLIEF